MRNPEIAPQRNRSVITQMRKSRNSGDLTDDVTSAGILHKGAHGSFRTGSINTAKAPSSGDLDPVLIHNVALFIDIQGRVREGFYFGHSTNLSGRSLVEKRRKYGWIFSTPAPPRAGFTYIYIAAQEAI